MPRTPSTRLNYGALHALETRDLRWTDDQSDSLQDALDKDVDSLGFRLIDESGDILQA